jgi:endoglucanase
MHEATIKNIWNVKFRQQGTKYLLTPYNWGQNLEPNQVQDFGFCAAKQGQNYQPQQIFISSH